MNAPDSLNQSYATREIRMQRQRTLEILAPKPGEKILDIGCGTGFLSAELANTVGTAGQVLGIDKNDDMIAAATDRCRDMPQARFLPGDVTDLKLSPDTFDAVTCTQVLLYVKDVARGISEMVRVLRPGGRLLVLETDWRSAILNSTDPATTEAVFRSWDQNVPSPNLPVKLARLMQEQGLEVQTVETIPLLSTRLDQQSFSAHIPDWMAAVAVKRGVITDDRAEAWKEGIRRLGENGEHFFCVNRFVFCGTRET